MHDSIINNPSVIQSFCPLITNHFSQFIITDGCCIVRFYWKYFDAAKSHEEKLTGNFLQVWTQSIRFYQANKFVNEFTWATWRRVIDVALGLKWSYVSLAPHFRVSKLWFAYDSLHIHQNRVSHMICDISNLWKPSNSNTCTDSYNNSPYSKKYWPIWLSHFQKIEKSDFIFEIRKWVFELCRIKHFNGVRKVYFFIKFIV